MQSGIVFLILFFTFFIIIRIIFIQLHKQEKYIKGYHVMSDKKNSIKTH